MIRPSTTMKIAAAMRNVMVYRSRIFAPSLVTAIGGYSEVRNFWPSSRRVTPREARIRDTRTTPAPGARAKSAVPVVRDRGELAIKVLERGRVPHGARRPVSEQARSTALRVEPRPFYPERLPSCVKPSVGHAHGRPDRDRRDVRAT